MTSQPISFTTSLRWVSADIWLPQRRDRLILLGTTKTFTWREPKSLRRISLKSILEKEPEIEIPDYVTRRMDGAYRDRPIVSDPERGDIAPTCVAHYSRDRSTRLVADKRFPRGVRPYTVREYARLQGVPDSFVFKGTDSKAYEMIGNGVSVPVARWVGSEIKRYFS
jgi:DNA (cytosine-5)-methyltransferase 1